MHGDTGVILPEGLVHPKHWPDPQLPEGEPENALSQQQIELVRARLVQNRLPLALTAAMLLEQINAYRFEVYANNQLATGQPEFRDGLLAFLDQLAASVAEIVTTVPLDETSPTDADVKKAATWWARFSKQWKEGEQYLSPENAADAAKPLGIILSCGIFGSLLGGVAGGPAAAAAGFGGGSMFGQMITKHIKPGAAADKLQDIFDAASDTEPK
jgi:hypothetical protein